MEVEERNRGVDVREVESILKCKELKTGGNWRKESRYRLFDVRGQESILKGKELKKRWKCKWEKMIQRIWCKGRGGGIEMLKTAKIGNWKEGTWKRESHAIEEEKLLKCICVRVEHHVCWSGVTGRGAEVKEPSHVIDVIKCGVWALWSVSDPVFSNIKIKRQNHQRGKETRKSVLWPHYMRQMTKAFICVPLK